MDQKARTLIRGLFQSLAAAVEMIVEGDNPAMLNGHAPKPLELPAPVVEPPKKKAAKAVKRKYTRRRDVAEEIDDEEEEEDDEPAQTMTRAISMTEATETVGRFIAKKGLYMSFDGNEIRSAFANPIDAQTLTYATKRWIEQGIIERTEKGNKHKPSKFRKVKVMEGED